ncbi:hypothetical protein POM88_029361 [Heracleum sosnowskyi]|uniref:Peptidase S8/S53 domain-containing protein n=1 Tax=Heracleum sosnowskyi TaxID=360622 RepID=A0AAD8HVL6_9APIA|nr:hypothetical protein POM88_029361 [Heracleum sosnowskyi]
MDAGNTNVGVLRADGGKHKERFYVDLIPGRTNIVSLKKLRREAGEAVSDDSSEENKNEAVDARPRKRAKNPLDTAAVSAVKGNSKSKPLECNLGKDCCKGGLPIRLKTAGGVLILKKNSHSCSKLNPGKNTSFRSAAHGLLHSRSSMRTNIKQPRKIGRKELPCQILPFTGHALGTASVNMTGTPKSWNAMLDLSILQLKMFVDQSKTPLLGVQRADASLPDTEIQLSPELKEKLGEVARWMKLNDRRISEKLIDRLMDILGKYLKRKTLKKILREMILENLYASKAEHTNFKQIKYELVKMIKQLAPSLNTKVYSASRIGDHLENKLCDLYHTFIQDTLIWKSILNEYSMKMKAEKPIYNSETANGVSMASLTERSFNWLGFTSAMISNISFTYRSIYSKKAMGTSLNGFTLNGTAFPLVYSGDVNNITFGVDPGESRQCLWGTLSSEAEGGIVLCDANYDGVAARMANAAGLIMPFSDLEIAVSFSVPAVMISYEDHAKLFDYIRTTVKPISTILHTEAFKDIMAPLVTEFSSRGPNPISPEILKPDITAPGANILAAWSPLALFSIDIFDKRTVDYNIISGTSMSCIPDPGSGAVTSCPHATGVAAYVKASHPDWSPAAIKSALMTTANIMDPRKNSDAEFAYRSGQIDPLKAVDPGLVFDASEADYVDFLCNEGYNASLVRLISGDARRPIIVDYSPVTDFREATCRQYEENICNRGGHYVGAKGRSKKESQQLAARDVILSILDSDARTVISKIIIKWRLSSAKEIVKYPCNAQNEVMLVGYKLNLMLAPV